MWGESDRLQYVSTKVLCVSWFGSWKPHSQRRSTGSPSMTAVTVRSSEMAKKTQLDVERAHQVIPQHGCIPAEPASVSRSEVIVALPRPSVSTSGLPIIHPRMASGLFGPEHMARFWSA